MSCERFEGEWVGYHFGAELGLPRAELEAHLLQCGRCLSGYLAVKREVELGGDTPAPAPDSHARLRRKMALQLRPARRWWELPVAFGSAATAVVLSVVVVFTLSTGPGAAPRTLSERSVGSTRGP